MLYRNFLAMECEELLRSHPIDGAVLMGGCDKTTPGLIMGAITQMAVAGVDLTPGIDDADNRFAHPIGAVITELAQPRAMSERAQIVAAEPAIGAQLVWRSCFAHGYRNLFRSRPGGLHHLCPLRSFVGNHFAEILGLAGN
jgi:hypothetical protein